MKSILLLISCCCLFVASSLYGQKKSEKEAYLDVIYLKNGSEFRGHITKYEKDFIEIKILGGHEITVEQQQIDKIIQEQVQADKSKDYAFKEKGIYHSITLSFLPGTAAWNDDFAWGFGLKSVLGYQFNRWIGAGVGIGINNYFPNQGETLYPVFVEARGYFNQKTIVPYYAVSAGYSFAFANENRNIIGAKGGYQFHPAIGLRMGSRAGANFTVDAGVQLQKATFDRTINSWRGPETQEYRMHYKRFVIRMGLLF